jgi:small-conductance mechanosensitive channel
MGISYDSDIDRAFAIMREQAQAHPNFLDKRSEEEIQQGNDPIRTRVIGFGDSSVNLRARVWTKDHSNGFALKTALNKSIKEEFDKQGVEIPFPYRTIVYKDPK